MRLPDLLTPEDLPAAELAALRLDGSLYPLAGAWRPVDLPETRDARAGAAATLLAPPFVADRLTAAWVHGAADRPPDPIQCCVPVSERGPLGPPGSVVRELKLRDGDLQRIGALRLTTPMRTAADLLRSATWDDATRSAVRRLVGRPDCAPAAVADFIGDDRFAAHGATARRRLATLQPATV